MDTPQYPCIEWPKTSQNLSINVDVYLSYTLGQQEVDLRTDVRNAFGQWNGVAARNPHLQETISTSNEEVWVTVTTVRNDAGDPFAYNTYATTSWTYQATTPYHIQSSRVRFNPAIIWNRNYNFTDNGTVAWADARKVAVHEFGHVEGLAHVLPPTVAVMRQGAVTEWWARVDDHNGIKHIYGAYP